MSSQKNQHYVPKAHLKPFSLNGEGKAINIFNINRHELFENAPTKSRCAGSFFYGDDKLLENLFGVIEGRYASYVREIADGKITDTAIDWMKLFVILQHTRTQFAVDKMRAFHEMGASIKFKGRTLGEEYPVDISHGAMVAGSLENFLSMAPFVFDLKLCVLQNRTKFPFVTSDNPVVFTNRYHIQKRNDDGFGIATSGALIFLPISPRQVICVYDGGLYKIDEHSLIANIKKPADVLAINEFQYLNAQQNFYFHDAADGERLAAEYSAVEGLRVAGMVKTIEMAEVAEAKGFKKYRYVANSVSADSGRSKVVMFQSVHRRPRKWPSILEIRSRITAYENGSAMGLVRNPEWLMGIKPTWK